MAGWRYLPARRCQRVAFSIFLCFFLRMRLRRFLISDPMACGRLAGPEPYPPGHPTGAAPCGPGRWEKPSERGWIVPYRLVGLDHVQLAMPAGREAEAEAFYAGLLGLTRQPKPPPLDARGGCWFSNGPVVLHLGVEADFRPARKAHPALVVDDLDALTERLAAEGVTAAPRHRPARGPPLLRGRPLREPPRAHRRGLTGTGPPVRGVTALLLDRGQAQGPPRAGSHRGERRRQLVGPHVRGSRTGYPHSSSQINSGASSAQWPKASQATGSTRRRRVTATAGPPGAWAGSARWVRRRPGRARPPGGVGGPRRTR